jgi:hypothetical protein
MSISVVSADDEYVRGLAQRTCAKIRERFPEATFDVRMHPSQRGAIIDAHVPTDDDFEVLDLVNPELDDLLIDEDIAIYVRALGPRPVEQP